MQSSALLDAGWLSNIYRVKQTTTASVNQGPAVPDLQDRFVDENMYCHCSPSVFESLRGSQTGRCLADAVHQPGTSCAGMNLMLGIGIKQAGNSIDTCTGSQQVRKSCKATAEHWP